MMTRKIIFILSILSRIFWQTAGLILAAFYLIYRFFIPHAEGSHPLSKFFRKVFEHKKARTSWGIITLVLILLASPVFTHLSNQPYFKQEVVLAAPENIMTTESTYQKPTQGYLSQGFYWYHQAVDISTDLGKEVYPIGTGKVEVVEYGKWGYGHFVVINHENEQKSLYAHLGEIKVESGQEVDKNTVLGYVAMTGYTTGPHLHLEVYEKEGNLNPADLVPGVLPQIAYKK